MKKPSGNPNPKLTFSKANSIIIKFMLLLNEESEESNKQDKSKARTMFLRKLKSEATNFVEREIFSLLEANSVHLKRALDS